MQKTRSIFFAFLIISIIAVGCDQVIGQSGPQQLTIFAASSLSNAMDALTYGFQEIHPDVEVLRHYASSSKLASQLIEGAPADVFASANQIQMGHVIDAGRSHSDPVIFTTNQLTICVPLGNPGEIYSLRDLATPGISLIVAAPHTPIRNYTDLLIQNLGDSKIQDAITRNIVSEEVNVRQVVAKIALGEADAGVVYTSDLSQDLVNKLEQVDISSDQNLTAVYPITVIADSQISGIAQEFVDFVLSSQGQAILAESGFGPIPSP